MPSSGPEAWRQTILPSRGVGCTDVSEDEQTVERAPVVGAAERGYPLPGLLRYPNCKANAGWAWWFPQC